MTLYMILFVSAMAAALAIGGLLWLWKWFNAILDKETAMQNEREQHELDEEQ